MGFFVFHKPEMPRFNYIPRYYDPEKEELEKKKAAMGLDSNLTEEEKLRIKMKRTWGRLDENGRKTKTGDSFGKIRVYLILGFSLFAIYLIFFTPFVENFVAAFLKLGGK